MTTAGWTSEQFDNTPLPVVFELLEYWSDNPPTHLIQAALAGLGGKKKKKGKMPPLKSKAPKAVNKKAEAKLPEWIQKAREMAREESK